jgi:hypothetical protein
LIKFSSLKELLLSLLSLEGIEYEKTRHNTGRIFVSNLMKRLEKAGHRVGVKVLELYCWREKAAKGGEGKRFVRLIDILTFISSTVWKSLFGKGADSLEKCYKESGEIEDEYMIMDADPVTNMFVSVPLDMGNLNVASYLAGLIAGILDSASFPGTVTAVFSRPEDGSSQARDRTVFLIKFSAEVMEREARLG